MEYQIEDSDLNNIVTHYQNGVQAVLEELAQSPSVLPAGAHQIQTYDEFVSAVPTQKLTSSLNLVQMQRVYVDSTLRYADALQ